MIRWQHEEIAAKHRTFAILNSATPVGVLARHSWPVDRISSYFQGFLGDEVLAGLSSSDVPAKLVHESTPFFCQFFFVLRGHVRGDRRAGGFGREERWEIPT